MPPSVDIIVCAYNNRSILDQCLMSVMRQTHQPTSILVIDDHSTDGTCAHVMTNYPTIRCFHKEKNTGPSHSKNIGISLTNSEFIVFLDSDVQLTANWIEECLRVMVHNNTIGICGSKLFFTKDKNTINSAGGGMKKYGVGYNIGRGGIDKYTDIFCCLFVCSAAMMLRRGMLERTGGFDEDYFYGYEDLDIGWRANLCGYDVVSNPAAIAFHAESMTVNKMSEKVVFHSTKNKILTMLKNYSAHNVMIRVPFFILLLLSVIIFKRSRIPKLRAVAWNITHFDTTLIKRKIVQSVRVRTDSEIAYLLK